MPELDPRPEESVLAEWRPKFSIFFRKLVFIGLVTALLLNGIGFFEVIQRWQAGLPIGQSIYFGFVNRGYFWLVILPIPMAFYILIFDDHMEWMRHRKDAWRLTSQRLIFRNGLDDESAAEFDLADIRHVQLWMWWSLKFSLANGRTIVMKFLSRRKDVRNAIVMARSQWLEVPNV